MASRAATLNACRPAVRATLPAPVRRGRTVAAARSAAPRLPRPPRALPRLAARRGQGGETEECGVYTVCPGDTLSQLAESFGLSMDQILEVNPKITNPDNIQAGQQILIPQYLVHVVGADEDLDGIAGEYGVSIEAIIEANEMENADDYSEGDELWIPLTE